MNSVDQKLGQQFLSELAEIKQDLPYSLTLLRDLFSLTGERSLASLDEIAQTISQDQGLTTKILALANSAFYGLQAKVNSVSRAIALLGLKEVRNLVLILGAQSITVRHTFPPDFNLEDYWEHQLSVGVCCKSLASNIPGLDSDILFTAGLLHDFGKLITALHRPKDWMSIEHNRLERNISYAEAEEMHWGLEHGLIGAITLDSWNLPPELTEPVNWHHAPNLSADFPTESKIVCLSDALHHHIEDREAPVPEIAMDIATELEIEVELAASELENDLQDESLAQFLSHLY